ncbi:hypothetical protein GC209_16700 [bacterium]|nr:hypothetical protein [bacterium]
MMLWLLAVLVVAGAALAVLVLRAPDLATEFHRSLAAATASDVARPHPVVSEAAIAALPAPVQRYIRRSGALGQPRPASLTVTYEARLYIRPGAAPMTGQAVQYDRFDPPRRLFYMPSRIFGLPIAVLHDYDGTAASMRVRLARLFRLVDASGPEFSRIETVTLLNDLCLFAPGWLCDPRLSWTARDDRSAGVTFRNGPHQVSALLTFNERDELVDFTSNDRGAVQGCGRIRAMPWSTPIGDYTTFGGQRCFRQGAAIWHEAGADFTYGEFIVTDIKRN